MHNVRNVLIALLVASLLLVGLSACFQMPPVPEEPAGAGGSVIRDLNVPGTLTARNANVSGALSAGSASVGGTLAARNLDVTSGELTLEELTTEGLYADMLIAELAAISDTLIVSNVLVMGDMGIQGSFFPDNNYFPLTLSGNITESFTFTDTIAAAILPNDVTVGGMEFFSRAISNTVECNVLYTTTGITPTMNTIAITSTILTAGEVVTSSVDNDDLETGYLVEFVCNTDAGGYARDVMVTLWLK